LVDLHGARETEATLRGQAEAQAKVAELLEKQVAAGAIAASEASQSRINLNTTRLASQDAQRQSAEAQAQLADAVGVPAAALKGVKLSFDSMNRFPTNLVTGELRRQAALTRNDVLSALADYAASQASLQLELAKQFPDLHINPGYQLDQTDNKWTLGATLTLPVLNQNQGGIAEARARREEAAATFISVQAKALGEVDRAAAGYQAAKEQVGTGRTLVADLQQRLTATQQMLEVGEVDGLALATAKAEFSAGLLAQTTSLLKAEQALAVLEDAIQSPLALPVHGPVWEQNPRAASELRRD
jgi:outer membrane protein TolC